MGIMLSVLPVPLAKMIFEVRVDYLFVPAAVVALGARRAGCGQAKGDDHR